MGVIAPAADPFADPARWHVVPGVPVFDEHDETDEDGSIRRFGPRDLQTIAARTNEREQEAGTPCAIMVGHTKDDAPESEQGDIVGYARNWRVGTPAFGPTRKTCLLADFWVKADRADEVREYPHRSIELWPGDWFVDPVSLLKRTPERPLGVLTYGRRRPGRSPWRYARNDSDRQTYRVGCSMPETPTPAMPDQMKKKYAADDAAGDGAEAYAHDGEPVVPAPPAGKPVTDEDPVYQYARQMYQAHCDKMAMSEPAAGAVAVPGATESDKPEQMARYSRLEAENRKLRAAVRRAELEKLAASGVSVDVSEELADTASLTDEAFARHCQKVARKYQRSPVGGRIRVDAPAAATEDDRRAKVERATRLAREKGIPFADALAQVG